MKRSHFRLLLPYTTIAKFLKPDYTFFSKFSSTFIVICQITELTACNFNVVAPTTTVVFPCPLLRVNKTKTFLSRINAIQINWYLYMIHSFLKLQYISEIKVCSMIKVWLQVNLLSFLTITPGQYGFYQNHTLEEIFFVIFHMTHFPIHSTP